MDKHERVFASLGSLQDIDLWIEPIGISVERFHHLDLTRDYDPLIQFGGQDGILPNQNEATSAQIRYAIIRWTTPHTELYWDVNLPQHIANLQNMTYESSDFYSYPNEGSRSYTFERSKLLELAHATIAVDQILDTLNAFLYRRPRDLFQVDVGCKLIRLVAWHRNKTEMRMTIPVLLKRLTVAVNHIT